MFSPSNLADSAFPKCSASEEWTFVQTPLPREPTSLVRTPKPKNAKAIRRGIILKHNRNCFPISGSRRTEMNLIKAATLAALLFLLSTQIATAQTAAKNDSKATTFSSGGNIEIPEEIKIKLEQELIRRGYNPVTTREKFARLFRTRPVGDDRHDANMTGLAERSGSFDGIAASVSGGPDAQLTSTGLITGGVKAHAVMKDGVGPAKIYDIALYPIILSNGGSVFTMKVFASDNGRLLLQVEFLYDNMKIIYLDRSCKVRNYQEASIPEQEQVERQQIRLGIFPASNITIDFETGVGFFPWGGFMADWVRTQPAR